MKKKIVSVCLTAMLVGGLQSDIHAGGESC